MKIYKIKKNYNRPQVNLNIVQPISCVMIIVSKDSYSSKSWDGNDETIEGIQSGRNDYSNSPWNTNANEGVTFGKKSYEVSEW